jgi:hypothetical protein
VPPPAEPPAIVEAPALLPPAVEELPLELPPLPPLPSNSAPPQALTSTGTNAAIVSSAASLCAVSFTKVRPE